MSNYADLCENTQAYKMQNAKHRTNTKNMKLVALDWNGNYSQLKTKAMNRTNQSLFNHSNTSHVTAL